VASGFGPQIGATSRWQDIREKYYHTLAFIFEKAMTYANIKKLFWEDLKTLGKAINIGIRLNDIWVLARSWVLISIYINIF
jgi:hypothetical protein